MACTKLNGCKYCYSTQITIFHIHLFTIFTKIKYLYLTIETPILG